MVALCLHDWHLCKAVDLRLQRVITGGLSRGEEGTQRGAHNRSAIFTCTTGFTVVLRYQIDAFRFHKLIKPMQLHGPHAEYPTICIACSDCTFCPYRFGNCDDFVMSRPPCLKSRVVERLYHMNPDDHAKSWTLSFHHVCLRSASPFETSGI